MTVLETEEDTDERCVPPRKKFRLSLSARVRAISKSLYQTPLACNQEGVSEDRKNTYSKDSTDKMMNGQRNQSNHQDLGGDFTGGGSEGCRVATLCNLGNTCFLNSVIYTLRFAPSFLHNLHHLATDLMSLNEKQHQVKVKSSSLGRTGIPLSSSGNRSCSSKDLTASSIGDCNKPRIQIATQKLHELFVALRNLENRENSEPYQPDAFLQALREVNPIFEGNQQQDAHELLVCLLDNIRESFQLLVRHRESQFGQSNGGLLSSSSDASLERSNKSEVGNSKRNSRKAGKKKKISSSRIQQSSHIINGLSLKPYENGHTDFSENNDDSSGKATHRLESKRCFVSEVFQGVSLLRTTCLECEHVTERKETFFDICVPIDTDRTDENDDVGITENPSEVYRQAVVTSEVLRERDKYWCGSCLRYNEARRAVCFPSLPRLLILQLKRFSTVAGLMEKVNNHMPTPLTLQCFCEECSKDSQTQTMAVSAASSLKPRAAESHHRHVYDLYSVIMHHGATMTAGHYVAYTRVPGESLLHSEYANCDRDSTKSTSTLGHVNGIGSISSEKFSLPKILSFKKSSSSSITNANSDNKDSILSKMGCHGLDCCGIRPTKLSQRWLECDDEAVRTISVCELQEKLGSSARNSATPYLLFYVRSTT